MARANTTTIPAQVMVLLREALYTELERACEDAPDTMPEAGERSGWADVLEWIDGARGALDVIGWDAPAEQQDMTVPLDTAMIEALEADAELWDWLSNHRRNTSAEERKRARAKAETIQRFLATIRDGPSPATSKAGDA